MPGTATGTGRRLRHSSQVEATQGRPRGCWGLRAGTARAQGCPRVALAAAPRWSTGQEDVLGQDTGPAPWPRNKSRFLSRKEDSKEGPGGPGPSLRLPSHRDSSEFHVLSPSLTPFLGGTGQSHQGVFLPVLTPPPAGRGAAIPPEPCNPPCPLLPSGSEGPEVHARHGHRQDHLQEKAAPPPG